MASARQVRLLSALVSLSTLLVATGCAPPRAGVPRVNKPVTSSTDFSRGAVFEKISADELREARPAKRGQGGSGGPGSSGGQGGSGGGAPPAKQGNEPK